MIIDLPHMSFMVVSIVSALIFSACFSNKDDLANKFEFDVQYFP